jgi:hypothetical protein
MERLPLWYDERLGACAHHCRDDVQRHPSDRAAIAV